MNLDNIFSDTLYSIIQSNMSDLMERILPKEPTKMKSVRTFMGKFDPKMYALHGDGQYRVYDGYNRELSVLLFDVICAVTGSINFDNAVHAIQVMKNYIPKVIKPKEPKPIIILKEFKTVCAICNEVKDTKTDFYKGRGFLTCKKCFSKQVVDRRIK